MSKIFVDTIEPKTTGGNITLTTTGDVVAPKLIPKVKSAFTAGLSGNQSLVGTSGQKINFVSNGNLFQQFDLNNDFNNTDNKFTAPVSGIYVFHATLYDTGSANIYGIQLYVNGARKQNIILTKTNSPSNESFTGGTTVYKANANDYFQLYAVPSANVTIEQNPYHTYWMGYLLGGA